LQAGDRAVDSGNRSRIWPYGHNALKQALEHLGFGPCYHFTAMMRARHTSRWLRIARGGEPNWDEVMHGHCATTDWPAAHLCEFLNVPVPEIPFPHSNDTATMRRALLALRIIRVAVPVAIAAGVITLVAGLT
jgi:hypothetical protein